MIKKSLKMRQVFLASSLIIFSFIDDHAIADQTSLNQNPPLLEIPRYFNNPAINHEQPVIKYETEKKNSLLHKIFPKIRPSVEPLNYDVIHEYYKKGEYKRAKELALEYLTKVPKDGDVRLILGLIYLKEKNYQRARFEFEWVLRHYPNYVDARILLVKVELTENKDKVALQLIDDGLRLTPNNIDLLREKAIIVSRHYPVVNAAVVLPKKTTAEIIDKKSFLETTSDETIRNYFKQGKYQQAKRLALSYLATTPNDPDVRLVLGQIYVKDKKYSQARSEFQWILRHYPNYIDARLLLANTEVLQNKLQAAREINNEGLKLSPNNLNLLKQRSQISALQKSTLAANLSKKSIPEFIGNKILRYLKAGEHEHAKQLALDYLALAPNDPDVRLVLGQIYLKEKNYEYARIEFKWVLQHYPDYVDARVYLAKVEVAENRDSFALHLINEGLKLQPLNPYLLNEKAQLYISRKQNAVAAAIAKQATTANTDNTDAVEILQETLDEIKAIKPSSLYGLNEVGIFSENDYVSDLHGYWDLSQVYYTRDTTIGRVAAVVNYANRFATGATQEKLEFSPIINKNIYLDLVAAYSDTPELFPDYTYGGVAHFSIPGAVDLAAGGQFWSISDTYFTRATGAVSKYAGSYWFNFQPYYFVPKLGANSMLYTVTMRRYFSSADNSIGLTLGKGHTPDLADLQTVDFIKIRNEFAALKIEFPIFNHRFVASLGGSYAHWQYPNGLVRNLTGGLLGIKYRF